MGDRGLVMVLWEVSRRCNLSCKHCYSSSGVPLQGELSHQESLDLIGGIKRMGADYILFSGGEPLLHPHIVEYTEAATKAGIKVMTPTNGKIVDSDLVGKLKKAGMQEMHFSVDGPNAEINDYVRGKGSFAKAVEGIRTAKSEGMRVALVSVITAASYPAMEKFFDLGVSLGVDIISLKRFVPSGRGKLYPELQLTPAQNRQVLELVYSRKDDLKDKVLVRTSDPLKCLVDPECPAGPYDAICGGCVAGVASICITPEGNITPCPVIDLVLGNIRKDSLEEVWDNSDILMALRNRDNLKGKCGACEKRNVCGGCRGMAYNLKGDVMATDPFCEAFD